MVRNRVLTTRRISDSSFRGMNLIILVQFVIIAFLLAIISNEYLSNYWMQVWIAGKAHRYFYDRNDPAPPITWGRSKKLSCKNRVGVVHVVSRRERHFPNTFTP